VECSEDKVMRIKKEEENYFIKTVKRYYDTNNFLHKKATSHFE
jgi:hypothetical protein